MQGLGNPISRTLGPPTPPAAFGLVNQCASNISVFSLTAPVGDEVVEVLANIPVDVGQRLEQLLQARGWPATHRLTLFPERPGDADRRAPSQPELLALESGGASTQPAYRLGSLFDALSSGIANPATANVLQLRQLADEIYRISSRHLAEAPGAYPPPVDVLRAFLRGEGLPSNYLAKTTFAPANLASAGTGVNELLASVSPRPRVTLALTVGFGGFSNLQEFLDGTDPNDAFAKGSQPVTLEPPTVHIAVNLGGSIQLQWTFPQAYVGKLVFGAKTASSLDGNFEEILLVPSLTGPDTFEAVLPPPATPTAFYLFYLALNP